MGTIMLERRGSSALFSKTIPPHIIISSSECCMRCCYATLATVGLRMDRINAGGNYKGVYR